LAPNCPPPLPSVSLVPLSFPRILGPRLVFFLLWDGFRYGSRDPVSSRAGGPLLAFSVFFNVLPVWREYLSHVIYSHLSFAHFFFSLVILIPDMYSPFSDFRPTFTLTFLNAGVGPGSPRCFSCVLNPAPLRIPHPSPHNPLKSCLTIFV